VVCRSAARRAGIRKRVSPHVFRNASAYYTTFQKPFIPKQIAAGQYSFLAVYGHV
jgi:hypothetical protein